MKVKIIVSLLFGAVFLWLAFRGVDLSALLEALGSMDPLPLIPFFFLLILYHVLRVWRWGLLLQPTYTISFRSLLSMNMVGFLAINVLPARLGEFARPYLLLERENVPLGAGLASALIERLLDFLAMLAVLAVMVFAVDLPTREFMVGGQSYDLTAIIRRVFLLAALPAVGGLAGLMLFEPLMYKLLWWTIGRVAPGPARHMEAFFRSFMTSLRPLKQPRVLLLQLSLTLVIWSITVLTEYLMFKVFHMNHLGLDAAVTVLGVLLIGMLVPGPPLQVGVFESFTMAGLALFSVTGSQALAYALMLHWLQFFSLFVAGMYFLVKDQISFRKLIQLGQSLRTESQPSA